MYDACTKEICVVSTADEARDNDQVRCLYCGKVSRKVFCSQRHAAGYAIKTTTGLWFCKSHEGWQHNDCFLCKVEAYLKTGNLRGVDKNACGVYHPGYFTPCVLPTEHAGWHMGYGVGWETGGFRIDATGMAYTVP